MKKNYLMLATAFAVCMGAVATMTSCEEPQDNVDGGKDDVDSTTTLSGELKETKTLTAGSTWTLDGEYAVLEGGNLIIEEGVKIVAKDDTTVDYIIVSAEGKISAKGTESKPIVMTSELKEHGAWGGIHICGVAPINLTAQGESEVGDLNYGTPTADGSVAAADPTVAGERVALEYVVVKYAGYSWKADKEANGFTFYGVSNKDTKLSNLVAYKGSDDGYEWFGGNVEATNLYSFDNEDDSFDWTYGFTGVITNAYAQQLSENCDHLIEGDNNKSNPAYAPVSCPTFKGDVTLVGISGGDRAVRIRRGSRIIFDQGAKVYIAGKNIAFDVQSEQSNNFFKAGSVFKADDVKVYAAEAIVVNQGDKEADASYNITDADIKGIDAAPSTPAPIATWVSDVVEL